MKRDLNKGTKSRDLGDPETKRLWSECDRMNTEIEPPDGHWVPVRSVVVDPGVLPRTVDEETARRYAENFRRLPPIRVQAKSLILFSGRHRLRAAEYASSDYILANEEDIPDDELADEAIRANVGHGRPYTLPERQTNAKAIMKRHGDWGMPRVAEWSGVSVRWLHEQRAKAEQKARESGERSSPVHFARVVGRDGVSRTKTAAPKPAPKPAPVSTFDPGREPDPDFEAHRVSPAPGAVAPSSAPAAAGKSGDLDQDDGPAERATCADCGGRDVDCLTCDGFGAAPATCEDSSLVQDEPDDEPEQDYDAFSFARDGAIIACNWRIVAGSAATRRALTEGLDDLVKWIGRIDAGAAL